MPLYKLTEKRLKKRQREDEDGVTELKAKMRAMGEEIGDSEDEMDSESDDSEEEGSEDDEEDSGEEAAGEISGSDDMEEDEEEEGEEESGSDEDEDEDEDGPIPMTPSEVLTDPIYTPTTIPTDSDSEGEDEGAGARPKIKLCILCPGKILKNEHMVKVHLDSGAHKRAVKRYSSYLSANPPGKTDDPRKIARSLVPSAPAPSLKSDKAKSITIIKTEEDKKGEKKKQPSKKGLKSTARGNRKQARVIAKIEERLAKGEVDPKNGEGMEGLNRKMRRELFRRLKTKEEGEGHKEKKQKN
ncbi:uncharacterized protein IAS62_001875 [Cryptococcus decagattii]|uniref:Uncharacterized protein n=1 Tax=Cryptococcus decagattii TaxID=1859122 RepID=A0ABZ2AQA0_9TREE